MKTRDGKKIKRGMFVWYRNWNGLIRSSQVWDVSKKGWRARGGVPLAIQCGASVFSSESKATRYA